MGNRKKISSRRKFCYPRRFAWNLRHPDKKVKEMQKLITFLQGPPLEECYRYKMAKAAMTTMLKTVKYITLSSLKARKT